MPIPFSDPRFANEYRGERGLYAVTTTLNKKENIFKVGLTGDFVKRFHQYRRCSLQKPTTAIIVEALIVDFTMNLRDAEKIMLSELSAYRQSQWDTEALTEWIQVDRDVMFKALETTAARLGGTLIRKFEKELKGQTAPPAPTDDPIDPKRYIVKQSDSKVLVHVVEDRPRSLPAMFNPAVHPPLDDPYWRENVPTVVFQKWYHITEVIGTPEYTAWLKAKSKSMARQVRAAGGAVAMPK